MSSKKIVFDLETCGLNGEVIMMIGEPKRGVVHFYDPEKSKAITEHGQKLVREMMEKMKEDDNSASSTN